MVTGKSRIPNVEFPARRSIARLYLLTALVVIPLCLDSQIAQAQGQRRLFDVIADAAARRSPGQEAVLIEPSAPIVNLFSRAEEGIERRDWKLAIDSLQRIIDDPGDSLVRSVRGSPDDLVRYESARRVACRRLALLPPPCLRAYRLLYDGKAKALLGRGTVNHDPQALRTVVDRYLLTRYGDDASELLASWALDEGRPTEALALLTDIVRLVPDYDVPKRLIDLKMAVSYAWLGRSDEAASLLALYGGPAGDSRIGEAVEKAPPVDIGLIETFRSASLGEDCVYEKTRDVRSWPVVGGSPARRGRMPPVTPAFPENLPWRFDMPGVSSGVPGASSVAWRPVPTGDPTESPVLPVAQLVVDAGRVFARTSQGCVALGTEDLEPLWELRRPVQRPPSQMLQQFQNQLARWYPFDAAAYESTEDQVVGSVSVAHGLVFTVERGDRGPESSVATDVLLVPGFQIPGADRIDTATRLVACDADTGEIRWQRGRTADPTDVLGDVEFRAAPIAVGRALWAPYVKQRDFFVAIIDPKDGSLIRNILLCTLPSPVGPSRHAQRLAGSERLVFVPSGYGVLFAVDADDYSLRWATQYAVADDWEDHRTWEGVGRRVSSSPVVSGGTVLLAPADRSELLAFSTIDGEPQWSVPLDSTSYIIAADRGRIWLGGRRFSSLSLIDGELLWTADVPSVPTGRAALSGDIVYIPTWDELVSLDAATGEISRREPLPASQGPLGNLLCIDNAMFSADPASIRKFPDIDRAYGTALARHEADPSDAAGVLALAWLELLRGEPGRAYDVLGSVPNDLLENDDRRATAVARVRVELLLALAGGPTTADADALRLLEQAGKTARTSSSRLRCGLALAEHLHARDRNEEAFRRLLDLGLTPDAGQLYPVDVHVNSAARLEIARRLRKIIPLLNDDQLARQRARLDSLADTAAQALADPSRPRRVGAGQRLRAVADLDPIGPIGADALIELANMRVRQERYEQAEQLLRECVRMDVEPTTTVTALIRLCDLYAAPDQSLVSALRHGLDELGTRFAALALPNRPGETVGDWVERRRTHTSGPHLTRDERADTSATFVLTGEFAWQPLVAEAGDPTPTLVSFGDDALEVLTDRIVLFGPGDVIHCSDANTGDTLWRAPLRQPESFRRMEHGGYIHYSDAPRCAVADGQTAVFGGSDGLCAVGLVTGKRIWGRPYEYSTPPASARYRDMTIAARDGLLAALLRPGCLTLMRMGDGETVWERDLRGEPVDYVRMYDGLVVTADARLERVHIFDTEDGRLIKQVLFRQPDPESQPIDIVQADRVLCGPVSTSGGDEVVAVDLDSGKTVWRTTLPKPLVQLFKPAASYVGIGLAGGNVRIVSAPTGEVVLEQRLPGVDRVVGGTLFDGTLLVRQLDAAGGDATLTAIDVATAARLWSRDDLAPIERVNRPLRVIGGVLPAVVRYRDTEDAQTARLVLTIIDARTGANVGPGLELPFGRRDIHRGIDLGIWPGVIVVGTGSAILPLETRPTAGAGKETS